jgi:hypothetical protein
VGEFGGQHKHKTGPNAAPANQCRLPSQRYNGMFMKKHAPLRAFQNFFDLTTNL